RQPPPREPRADVAELRLDVRRTQHARLDGMMDLSELHALIESVRDDLVGFLEDLELELLFIRTVCADGRDVSARPNPFPPYERLPGGRHGDHDIGAADRLLDGLRGQDADAMERLHLLRKGRRLRLGPPEGNHPLRRSYPEAGGELVARLGAHPDDPDSRYVAVREQIRRQSTRGTRP